MEKDSLLTEQWRFYVITGSSSFPLDGQPYNAYTINRDDFRGNHQYGCVQPAMQAYFGERSSAF